MIREARLKTANMLIDVSPDDPDYQLWKKIYEYMDGETAIVMKSTSGDGTYLFLGLKDKEKNKELHYMFEQDSFIGVYIDDREEFDRDWDSGDYEPDGCHYLNPENVELLESEKPEVQDKSKKLSVKEECCYTCYNNRNRLDRNYNCNCEITKGYGTQDGWCPEYEGEE